jgi:cyclic pyranopterin monophosphate synthase
MSKLSHVDSQGRARMVDIEQKDTVHRIAKASGFISLSAETLELIRQNSIKKGDVLTVAEIAGMQAAKRTHELIPLAHNIVLECINVTARIEGKGIAIDSEVICTGKTGVEMEALTAVSVALLTVYDMCKAVDKTMEISQIKMINKLKTALQL